MNGVKFLFSATGLLWLFFTITITTVLLLKIETVSLALLELLPYGFIITTVGLLTLLTTFFGHIWRGPQKSGYYIYAIYGAIGPGLAFFLFDLTDDYFTPTGISLKFVGSGIIIGAVNGLVSRYLLARFGGYSVS
ncbi:MAG: hypothetical protein JKY82_11060 [Rhizobiaceae bacterium]|nr:hypothetical protein [Rhizobiaceae bacterium]